MSLELAIEEFEKLVGDKRIEENPSNNVINKSKDYLACVEISFRKIQKAITRAERCGHSVQNIVVSCDRNVFFECEKCAKKTFVNNCISNSTNQQTVNPWEGDIEVVDIDCDEDQKDSEIQEMQKAIVDDLLIQNKGCETDMIQDILVDGMKKSDDELLLQENLAMTETKSDTASEQVDPEGTEKQTVKCKTFDQKCRVMFSGYRCKDHAKIVADIGGRLTSKLKNCSVMVTDKLRMTSKILTMLGKGVPVVSPAWVLECEEQGMFVDPWDFILKDQFREKLWNFSLRESLITAEKDLFKGYSIHITKNVKPGAELFKDMIEHLGGTFVSKAPETKGKQLFAIGCDEDKEMVKKFKDKGVHVVTRDFFTSAVLKQKLPDFDKYIM